jgi:hypothetical protein
MVRKVKSRIFKSEFLLTKKGKFQENRSAAKVVFKIKTEFSDDQTKNKNEKRK